MVLTMFFFYEFLNTSGQKGLCIMQIHTRDFGEKNLPKSSYLEVKKMNSLYLDNKNNISPEYNKFFDFFLIYIFDL
jgi:hypothetical protein